MKFKVGGRSPAEEAARFAVAREAAGPEFVLMADAHAESPEVATEIAVAFAHVAVVVVLTCPAAFFSVAVIVSVKFDSSLAVLLGSIVRLASVQPSTLTEVWPLEAVKV